ncbi:MAG: IS256 family transposase [Sporichthyaceae bacterium]
MVPAASVVPALDVADLAEQLVASANGQGIQLTGEGGLLTALTRRVLQSALETEMNAHLGYAKHDRAGADRDGPANGNVRNGSSTKTIRTEIGEVTIQVPRDRAGTFEPQIVPKHARRLSGFDDAVISLYAKGMTTGDIAAHLAEVYDTEISRDLVSRVTDAVVADMRAWQARPLDRVYPVVLIDAIYLKIREGAVANRPVYVAIGISLDGYRDVLGLWMGPSGGEGAKQWLNMLTDLRNRGIMDVCIVCCDGLKGLPDAIATTWPLATVQTCVVHLVRNSLRYTQRRDWKQVASELKEVYTAPSVEAAEFQFECFAEQWGKRYPALISLWRNAWQEFIPFLDCPLELRKLIYTTNGIESLNARFRAAVRRRGHFPDEQSALKVLFLTVQHREKNRPNPNGRINNWTPILNTLTQIYGDRLGLN